MSTTVHAVGTRPSPKELQAVPVSELAQQAGFQSEVRVLPIVIDKVFIADGRHSVNECLAVFLKACAEQLKIAITDNKCWQTTRFMYLMESIEGRFYPEEVIIYTHDNGDVVISCATAEEFIRA